MSQSLNIKAKKAGIWYTVANLILKGCVFLSLPFFTRLLSTKDFGIYNTYIAYETLVQAVLGLGLYGTVKNAKLDFNDEYRKYVSSVFFLSIVWFILVLSFCNIFYPFYSSYLSFSRLIINCLLFQSFGGYFIHFYGTYLNVEFKYKSFVIISFINTVGSIILSILLIIYVFPNERYLGRIFGSALFPVLITFFLGFYILVRFRTLFNKKYWKFALVIGLPLIIHVISQSLLSQFDRIMISNMVGNSESGIYSYMYTLCSVTYIIALSMDNAWTPWVFYKIKDREEKSVKIASKKYIQLFTILSIGFMIMVPEVAKIMASPSYWKGIDLAIPLIISNYLIFMYFLPVSVEYYHKKTLFISIGTFFASLINVVLNTFAIRLYGYKAAAFTTLVAYFILFIFHSIVASKYNYSKIYDIKTMLSNFAALILVGIVFHLTSAIPLLNFCIRYCLLIIIIIYLFIHKNSFIDIRST